ncbi:MAG TPA: sulfite exporter TauE/SafE family protein [Planctomycetota bacterium]|nr:sulfite exporter TauE/SafE family protein [Planctomycetota bacterium]
MDAAAILITAVAGVAMGAINNVAGGAGILALWAFEYACDLPLAVANPSSRLGAIGVGLFAWLGFVRAGIRPGKEVWRLAMFAIPGAFAGNLLALKANDLAFRSYLVVVLVLLLGQQLLRRPRDRRPDAPRWLGPIGCVLIGVHMGFAQIGTGFVAALVLVATYHDDLLHVNAAKGVVVITSSVASLLGFALAPHVLVNQSPVIAWGPAACLAVGTATGSYLASQWTVDKGSVAVRRAVVAIAALALLDQVRGIVMLLVA